MTTTLNGIYGLPATCVQCEAAWCFYCDNPLSKRHEHDHFPVPARAGGKHVVAACYNCHDLKDRMTVAEWPVSMQFLGTRDLIVALGIKPDRLPADVVDVPERALVYVFREVVQRLDFHRTPGWQRLSVPGRVLFAKLACLMTGDYPADTESKRERRRDLLAPWVDRDDPRYSDDGPTARVGQVRGAGAEVIPLRGTPA